jgi:hypothetical protein
LHPSENELEEAEALIELLEASYQLKLQIKCSKRAEVQEVISNLNPKISPSYDLITGKILKELLIIRVKYLTGLFIAVLLKGYLPMQWEIAQIILSMKPGKLPTEITSYPLYLTFLKSCS